VLSDGTNTYLYGAGRIAQKHNSITEYYLDDALGSVRQLTNSGGEVVLAQAYDPYGSLVENNAYDGVTTAYGYAGEFTDTSGMVYLRARYYSPAQGRFLSRDVWEGDYNNPLSLNRWGYVEGNPINYTDPSGHDKYDQYYYDREKAVSYAMEWDQQPGLNPKYDFSATKGPFEISSECTLFASSVLYEGDIVDPRGNPYEKGRDSDYEDIPFWDINILKKDKWWNSYKGTSWFNTTDFYNFVHLRGQTRLIGKNPPQYNAASVYCNETIDNNWENMLLAVHGIINKGDLVFYKEVGHSEWTHVAIVVGWGEPTSFGLFNDNPPSGTNENLIENLQDKCYDPSTEPPSRPLVVERSGGIDYVDYRSLDNTSKKQDTIEIVSVNK